MYQLNIPRIEKDIPPCIGQIRFAKMSDAAYILPLCTEPMKRTFRVYEVKHIESLINVSVLSITQQDVGGKIIGFMSLKNFPVIPSVLPGAWEEYIWTRYKSIELNARNTLWIHLMCWNLRYDRELMENLLRSVFMHDFHLKHIAFIKTDTTCPQLVPGSLIAETCFRRVQTIERGMSEDKLPTLFVADRKDICPKLRVRCALEEDNDDIVPIVHQHSDRLRQLYGEFYVSEIIGDLGSKRTLLVCEHNDFAVGLTSLSSQINFEELEKNFDLFPFAGLRHLDKPPRQVRIDNDMPVQSEHGLIDSDEETEAMVEKIKEINKISKKMVFANTENMMDEDTELDEMKCLSYQSLKEEDSDSDSFDIVNINPELLLVPDIEPRKDISTSVRSIDNKEQDAKSENMKKPPAPAEKEHEIYVRRLPHLQYSGTPNAFLLELCVMNEDYDERYAFDMLEASFDIFPGREYCIMSLPSSHPPFPLLEHFTLVTPRPTNMRFVGESLYVVHISSMRGDVSVRRGELVDEKHLMQVMEHVLHKDSLHALFLESLTSLHLQSFVLLAQRQPVGLVIVSFLEDYVPMRIQFNLHPDTLCTGMDGVILGGVLSPALESHSRWYLREVLRYTTKDSLFWVSQLGQGEMAPIRNMMSLTEGMVPVRARSRIPNICKQKVIDECFENTSIAFALWAMNSRLSSHPKICVNSNIVVVGSSSVALAFLETLILGSTASYLTFTNLTLVTEFGLPTFTESLKVADIATPIVNRYTSRCLKEIPFGFYVDIITGVMVKIDRSKRCIHLKDGGTKNYDFLVIACGKQFQHPNYMRESLQRVTTLQKGKPCKRMLMDDPRYQPDYVPAPPQQPKNLFLINSLLQANAVFRELIETLNEDRNALNSSNPVIVYGDCIEAYCCIAALLECGVRGHEIVFVDDYPSDAIGSMRVNCFNDELIDERVQNCLEDLQIKIYRRYHMIKMEMDETRVTSIRLMDDLHIEELCCYALFYYGLKAIDIYAFKAINEANLVYDGGLIVGPKFETNDPNIFGAGPCCNYSRRLYASQSNFMHYNMEEVGEILAEMFIRKLDPLSRCHPYYQDMPFLPKYDPLVHGNSHASIPTVSDSRIFYTLPAPGREWEPVMRCHRSVRVAATLPGPLFYLRVHKPGRVIPMEVQLYLPHQGHTLVTDKDQNYFRLGLSELHIVNAITCLSRNPISSELIYQLYGKHESCFHNMLYKFQNNQIDDFYTYFTQPWMSAMYQEMFDELLSNINNKQIVNDISEILNLPSAGDSPDLVPTGCTEECKGLEEEHRIEMLTLRSILSRYVKGVIERVNYHGEECGQKKIDRNSIRKFWDRLSGDDMMEVEVSRHIDKYKSSNPAYAQGKRDFFTNK